METQQPSTPGTGSGPDWGTPPPVRPPSYWEAPPEERGPAPGYAFGGFGERLVAYLVDWFLVSIVLIIVFLVGSEIATRVDLGGDGAAAAVLIGLTFLAALLVGFGYFPWFWARGGQTPGMRLFGLRVVRDSDGGPVGAGGAMLRLVGYCVSGALFSLGYIWILIDKRKRGWHDLIAGTVVVKRV